MHEAATPLASNRNDADTARSALVTGANATTSSNTTKAGRYQNRHGTQQSSTSKDFEGATPKIGGILALRSKNITNKITTFFARNWLFTR